ncbi:hypothetical protein [Mycoplasma bradburyae]|uniref:hypothetical protein n=1 Tax=Mycoplasma bradburyae TaxID=2963128 RepID=UPI002340EF41|nr:hypothetical protein [Mycoplasma bradburyae]MDC4183014.1 hypothetical protein [Mycoplasma bradburyae]
MERKNILKFISLLGVGSFVALSAASCKQQVSKKTEPMKPTTPGTDDNNPTGSSSGSTDTTAPSTDDGSGSSGNNNTEMNTNNDVATKEQATSLLNSLDNSKLEVYKDGSLANRKDVSLESFEVNKNSIQLKDKSLLPKGWTYDVKLVDNSKNKEEGTIKVMVSFTKDGETISSNDITLSGFQSLVTTVSSVLFKEQSVKGDNGMMVNKDVLDLGDAEFKTLSNLNSNVVIRTEDQPAAASPSDAPSVIERTSLRTEDSTSPESFTPTAATTNQEQTTVLGVQFRTLINKNDSPFKTEFEKVKQLYPEFDVEKLYLTGQAKLVSLFKKDSDWKGTYYLVSKENNKLTLKLKDKPNWSLEIPGLVIQNLLPDDVKVFVSSIEGISNFDSMNQSNLESYKNEVKKTENNTGSNIKYLLNNNKLSIANLSGNKSVNIDAIKVPYLTPKNIMNNQEVESGVFFKAKYIFDGNAYLDDSIFGTKLIFKKIFYKDERGTKEVLDASVLGDVFNGLSLIPGRESTVGASWNIPSLKKGSTSLVDQFFSKNGQSTGFNGSIHGVTNSKDGTGSNLLIQKNGTTSIFGNMYGSGSIDAWKSNVNKATNYIIFTRIAYKKDNTNGDMSFNYIWPNSVTILHFSSPTISSSENT